MTPVLSGNKNGDEISNSQADSPNGLSSPKIICSTRQAYTYANIRG